MKITLDRSLAEDLGFFLRRRGQTLCVAESCTGGLLASTITDINGSSAYFLGGIVSYSNQAKQTLLGVPEETLRTWGAVSAQTAEAMALGARRVFGADWAISITGIAGPGGGTPVKPVGLVYIGCAFSEGVRTVQHVWPHDRIGNKINSVNVAINWLMEFMN